jgi:AraC family transcriptional regulator
MYLPEHSHVEIQVQTRFRQTTDGTGMTPHSSSLYAPRQPHSGGIEENWEVIVMLLTPQLMARGADELFSRDRFEIKPFSMTRSPVVEGLSEAARGEFHSAYGPGLLFLESIGHAMSGYILRNHAETGPARRVRGTFSPGQLRSLDEFIDGRLDVDFGIDDLAALMKLGSQRFTERFRLTTGMPPWKYVQARRVHRAKSLLADRRVSLAEIALALGFCNQSHFANVFRKAAGLTPREYRNSIA